MAKRSHKRFAGAIANATSECDSYERTNERTDVDVNPDCDILQLSDVRARVQADDKGVGRPTHAGEWADACRACAADQKAGNA